MYCAGPFRWGAGALFVPVRCRADKPRTKKGTTDQRMFTARQSIFMAAAAAAMFGFLAINPAPIGTARAQDVLRIAAIVNDEVVSGFDVEQRVDLVIASANMRDSPDVRRRLRDQVLRGLIDERLQLQEATRFNVTATPEDVERAIGTIAAQNKMRPEQLDQFLASRDIPRSALESQLRAEIAWTKLVRRRFANSVQIGDEEIDEILQRLEDNAGKSQNRISEIFLPVDSPVAMPEVMNEARRLRQQLSQGADFAALARQFSRGPTAPEGGQVGWVQPGQLASELDAAIAELSVGEISEPIETISGIYIVRLDERRRIMARDPLDTTIGLRQLLFGYPPNATEDDRQAQRDFAQDVRATVENCADLAELGKQLGDNVYFDLGKVQLRDLPPAIRGSVENVEVDQFARPIASESGVMLLMVCEKVEPKVELPEREQIANSLRQQRLTTLAQRYLRDLRRAAVVELR